MGEGNFRKLVKDEQETETMSSKPRARLQSDGMAERPQRDQGDSPDSSQLSRVVRLSRPEGKGRKWGF